MGKWSDLARELSGPSPDSDISDVSDTSPPEPGKQAPNGANVTIVTVGIPEEIASGLASLKAMAAPRITRPEVWPAIVADALRLHREGWAERALALGWHPLELFGHGVKSGSEFESLAVWLTGRRIVLLDTGSAMVADGSRRQIFNRRSDFPDLVERGLIVPLWQFGGVRQKRQ